MRALSHLLQQPSLFALPHSYAKSGAMLLVNFTSNFHAKLGSMSILIVTNAYGWCRNLCKADYPGYS